MKECIESERNRGKETEMEEAREGESKGEDGEKVSKKGKAENKNPGKALWHDQSPLYIFWQRGTKSFHVVRNLLVKGMYTCVCVYIYKDLQ